MSHVKTSAWIVLLVACGLLTACASQTGCGTAEEAPVVVVDERPEPPAPTPVREVPVVLEEEAPDFINLPDGSRIAIDADGSVVRASFSFEFDEAELSSGDFRVLQEHAARLNRNRDQSVAVEGHCDERGTREYNLALGERRAIAVQDFLLANGVRPSQLSTRSYGEERPVDTASDEDAWAKNRRVELKYE